MMSAEQPVMASLSRADALQSGTFPDMGSPSDGQERVDAQEAPRTPQARSEKATSAQEAPHEEVRGDSLERRQAGSPYRRKVVTLDGEPHPELADFLFESWERDLETGLVAYDLEGVAVFQVGRYRFHFIPGRSTRPGSSNGSVVPPEGLFVPHRPCPFDAADIAGEREIVRVCRGGREHQLICNRFPVTTAHFLGVRPIEGATDDLLRQHLHGPEELEDLLLLVATLGPTMRVFFNSNRGADGSSAGSSINHWHFQLFPFDEDTPPPFRDGELRVDVERGGAVRGDIGGWPARHVAVDASRESIPAASALLWDSLLGVHARSAAYNVELMLRGDGVLRAVLYPRAPTEPTRIPGLGELNTSFGGWELSGDFIVPTRQIFDWIVAHPEEAEEMSTRRLETTTRTD